MFSILTLVCAGLLFILSADQWLECAHNDKQDKELSIIDKFQNNGEMRKTGNQEKISPLVSQAGEYALIIDPPAPPEVKVEEQPQPKLPAFAPRPSPKFRLLATSCNRDRPEDSVALVSEPGKAVYISIFACSRVGKVLL